GSARTIKTVHSGHTSCIATKARSSCSRVRSTLNASAILDPAPSAATLAKILPRTSQRTICISPTRPPPGPSYGEPTASRRNDIAPPGRPSQTSPLLRAGRNMEEVLQHFRQRGPELGSAGARFRPNQLVVLESLRGPHGRVAERVAERHAASEQDPATPGTARGSLNRGRVPCRGRGLDRFGHGSARGLDDTRVR